MSLLASIFGRSESNPSGSGSGGDDDSSKKSAGEKSNKPVTTATATLFDTLPTIDDAIKQRQEQLELRKLQHEANKRNLVSNNTTNSSIGSSAKKKRKREKKKDDDKDDNNEETAGNVENPENVATKEGVGVGGDDDDDEGAASADGGDEKTDAADVADTDQEEESRRTVFVGNLPITYNRKSLQKLFAPCGKISSTRLRSIAIAPEHGVKLPPEQAGNQALVHKVCVNTGKTIAAASAGSKAAASACIHGYVVFESVESVDAALKLNNTTIPDDEGSSNNNSTRRIRVDCANPTYDATRSIFVGNLPYHASEDSLQLHFFRGCDLANITDIESVRVVREHVGHENKCKGFGYILFKDKSMVSTALRHMNGTLYMKRPLRVQVCGRRFKGNKGGESGGESGGGGGGSNSGRPNAANKKTASAAAFGEKKKRWDDEDRPRKRVRAGGEQDNEESNNKKEHNDQGNVGALRRLLGKQAAASQKHASEKKHHRARGVKKTGSSKSKTKSSVSGRVGGGSKRAAVEAKVEKRVKKIQKRISKGMGKTRVK